MLGCSGAAPQPGIEAEQYPIAFVRAACARVDVCCAGRWGNTTTTEARTRCETMDEFSAALMGDLPDAVASGHTIYDGQRAERCLQVIASASCDVRIDVTRADVLGGDCAQAVRGMVDVGGACHNSWECQPGLFCDAVPQATPRCVSRRPLDAPCASEAQCASGRCVNHQCEERLPACMAY